LFNVTDENFAAVLWAPDDVIRQVEYGTSVLGVAAVFWLQQKPPADIYLSQFGQFQVVVRLTCRLKETVRRLFPYRKESFFPRFNRRQRAREPGDGR
jgi:hypothetical protein